LLKKRKKKFFEGLESKLELSSNYVAIIHKKYFLKFESNIKAIATGKLDKAKINVKMVELYYADAINERIKHNTIETCKYNFSKNRDWENVWLAKNSKDYDYIKTEHLIDKHLIEFFDYISDTNKGNKKYWPY
jgi:hypothetical protein